MARVRFRVRVSVRVRVRIRIRFRFTVWSVSRSGYGSKQVFRTRFGLALGSGLVSGLGIG